VYATSGGQWRRFSRAGKRDGERTHEPIVELGWPSKNTVVARQRSTFRLLRVGVSLRAAQKAYCAESLALVEGEALPLTLPLYGAERTQDDGTKGYLVALLLGSSFSREGRGEDGLKTKPRSRSVQEGAS